MAKPQEKITSVQGDLFQRLDEPTPLFGDQAHDLDLGLELMGALGRAIREAKHLGLSRERIVERMNLCLPEAERAITLRQLNAWTAQSKEYHEFPARYLPAFCWATGSLEPIAVLVRAIGHEVVDRRDQAALQLGQKLVDQSQLARDIHGLKQFLGG